MGEGLRPAPESGNPSCTGREISGAALPCRHQGHAEGVGEAYATFAAAFRDASERFREGDRMTRLTIGSFPQGLHFVVAEAVGPP